MVKKKITIDDVMLNKREDIKAVDVIVQFS